MVGSTPKLKKVYTMVYFEHLCGGCKKEFTVEGGGGLANMTTLVSFEWLSLYNNVYHLFYNLLISKRL